VSEIEFAKEGGILITAGGDVYELSQNAGLTATPVMDFG
jgi:hypothetical protein